jgi:hypothetical protein
MIFGLQTIPDIRRATRTAAAIDRMMDAWASKTTNKNGYVMSRRSNKKIPYEYVLHAGPVAKHDSRYSVRINLPLELKQFAGSRYGCWKQTGLPNGFEFVGFNTQQAACEFVKSIHQMALNGDVQAFTQFLKTGDGSDRYYKNLNEYYRNAHSYMANT